MVSTTTNCVLLNTLISAVLCVLCGPLRSLRLERFLTQGYAEGAEKTSLSLLLEQLDKLL